MFEGQMSHKSGFLVESMFVSVALCCLILVLSVCVYLGHDLVLSLILEHYL